MKHRQFSKLRSQSLSSPSRGQRCRPVLLFFSIALCVLLFRLVWSFSTLSRVDPLEEMTSTTLRNPVKIASAVLTAPLDSFVSTLRIHYGNLLVQEGNHLTPSQTSQPPTTITASHPKQGSLYAILMLDPDAPSHDNPIRAPWLHWLQVNVHSEVVSGKQVNWKDKKEHTGRSVIDYMGPSPPANTGYHRYIIYLFLQSQPVSVENLTQPKRPSFDWRQWRSQQQTEFTLIEGNYFKAQAE